MYFDESEQHRSFHAAWDSVEIARPVHYSLFTFGESALPYFLVCASEEPGGQVSVTQGEVRIKRPMIITPDNARGEFRNFFQNEEEREVAEFLLARNADFSNFQFVNESQNKSLVSDSVEEVLDRLNLQLDSEEEDRVAILTAPYHLGGVAILKYAAERVWESGPDNIQELRERGFLP